MGRIVRDHYPVDRLPEDLREGLASGRDVRVIVEELAPQASDPTMDGDHAAPKNEAMSRSALRELFARRKPTFTSAAEVEAHVRALRDEWD